MTLEARQPLVLNLRPNNMVPHPQFSVQLEVNTTDGYDDKGPIGAESGRQKPGGGLQVRLLRKACY